MIRLNISPRLKLNKIFNGYFKNNYEYSSSISRGGFIADLML
jgi:hypothetical protein